MSNCPVVVGRVRGSLGTESGGQPSLFQIPLSKNWRVLKSYLYYHDFPIGVLYETSGDYQKFLTEIRRQAGLVINETNTYGDASFYLNRPNSSANVNLVIQKGNMIYGFEYLRENHQLFLKLFEVLNYAPN